MTAVRLALAECGDMLAAARYNRTAEGLGAGP
jgi:hypothetical protein